MRPKTASLTGTSDVTFVVSDKVLDCVGSPDYNPELDPLIEGTYFNASAGLNPLDMTETGYAFGFRGPNGKSDSGTCEKTNFITTNNITGSPGVEDANGFKLPTNAFSVVFDRPPEDDVVLAYTLTFQPRLAAPNGRLNRRRRSGTVQTRTDQRTARIRQSQRVASVHELSQMSSLPGTEPACLAKYTWAIVEPSECGDTNAARCLKVTIGVIDGKDPPIMSD